MNHEETGADALCMDDVHILTVHISIWNALSEDMSLPTARSHHHVLTQRDQQFCAAPANVTGKDRETLQKYHLQSLLAFMVSLVNRFT